MATERASPELFPLGLGGAIGGLLGAALGHVAVVGAFTLTGDAGIWFKGPHGPPFFSLLINTAFFYAGVGAGIFRGAARLKGAALGFGAVFAAIYLPLAVCTRVFTWGEAPGSAPTMAWVYLVLAAYGTASIGGVWLLGALCGGPAPLPAVPGANGAPRGGGRFSWGRGLCAVCGLGAAYGLGMLLSRLVPSLRAPVPTGWLPPLGPLTDGALTGACVGAGAALSPLLGGTIRGIMSGRRTDMKKTAAIALFFVFAHAPLAQAQGVFSLPPIKQFKLPGPVSARPTATRVPLLRVLERYRLTRAVIPLGEQDYHLSIQLVRGDEWVLAMVPTGENHFALEASFTFTSLRKGMTREFAGRTYALSLKEDGPPSRHAVRFLAEDNPLGGMRVPLSVLKRAVWEKAVPLPSVGPDWRMLFQIDLWRGAGMRSFVFLHRTPEGIEFHRTGAEGVDWTREVVRAIGPRKLALSLDIEQLEGVLVVRPVPDDTPIGPLQP